MREPAEQLIRSDPNQYQILSLAAIRADWDTGIGMVGYTDFAFSHKAYRGAIKRLEKGNQRAIKTTNKGTLVNVIEAGFAEFGETKRAEGRAQKGQSKPKKRATNEDSLQDKKRDRELPPPFPLVVEYFQAKGELPIMAKRFFDHYESNGWKVGKNPMKKWKNAASGWITRQKEYANANAKPLTPREIASRLTQGRDNDVVRGTSGNVPRSLFEGHRGARSQSAAMAVLPAAQVLGSDQTGDGRNPRELPDVSPDDWRVYETDPENQR